MVCRCGKRPEDEYLVIGGESEINNPQTSMSDDENMLPP